jgi:hypothetical protein
MMDPNQLGYKRNVFFNKLHINEKEKETSWMVKWLKQSPCQLTFIHKNEQTQDHNSKDFFLTFFTYNKKIKMKFKYLNNLGFHKF